ncbi:MAG: hypothetical protein ACXVEF_40330 [Polyangiales bacterium]
MQVALSLAHGVLAWGFARTALSGSRLLVGGTFMGILAGVFLGHILSQLICGVGSIEFDRQAIRSGEHTYAWRDLIGIQQRSLALRSNIALLVRVGGQLKVVSVATNEVGGPRENVTRIQALRLRLAGKDGLEQPILNAWSWWRCAREVGVLYLLVPIVFFVRGVAIGHCVLLVAAVVELFILRRAYGGRLTGALSRMNTAVVLGEPIPNVGMSLAKWQVPAPGKQGALQSTPGRYR